MSKARKMLLAVGWLFCHLTRGGGYDRCEDRWGFRWRSSKGKKDGVVVVKRRGAEVSCENTPKERKRSLARATLYSGVSHALPRAAQG